MRFLLIILLLSISMRETRASGAPGPSPAPISPLISSLVKPSVLKRALDESEILTHASLENLGNEKLYSYYAVMLVKASLPLTRRVLTDYQLYAKMIPYVDRAAFDATTRILEIEGGIWQFKLSSQVQFEEKSDRWISFRFVEGHFRGMNGNIYFEPLGEKGTLVYLGGRQIGSIWPPKLVIERGAEIVFEFTAKRMRSYIQSQK